MKLDVIFQKKRLLGVVSIGGILLFFVISHINVEDSEYETTYQDTQSASGTTLTDDFVNLDSRNFTNDDYEAAINAYKSQLKQTQIKLTSSENIQFSFFPKTLEPKLLKTEKLSDMYELLFSKLFSKNNLSFDIELYEKKADTRGRYSHNTIKIFESSSVSREEFMSLFLHELGHFFDVKYLQKEVLSDMSNRFYDISWNDLFVRKDNQTQKDFVSGYAMTNKYEDFAESFNYYILFNDDFRQKMTTSDILKEKYAFFEKYIFRNDEFKRTNFRTSRPLLDYYRDTTKISFSIKNFLEYLKSGV